MKKLYPVLILCLLFTACSKAVTYETPFDTGGKVYKIALLPWRSSTMDFDFKYRWTVTQALQSACKQSGGFELVRSSYPVNGGNVGPIENVEAAKLWERLKYGRYVPVVDEVRKAVSGLGVDLALLYDISADNSDGEINGTPYSRLDSVRVFLVDVKTGRVVVEFVNTDFLRKLAYGDIKAVTLKVFNKWLLENGS